MSKQQVIGLGFFIITLASPSMVLAKSSVKVSPVIAQPTITPAETGDVLAAMQEKKKSEYILPYPGIAVDHPLYFLKRFRDQILEKLIVDPIRKSEFHLLQADKFLNMAIFLNNQGKVALATSVITKAETYMQQVVGELVAIKGNGAKIPGNVVDRLDKSMGKHVEVLEGMLTKIDALQKQAVTDALTMLKKVQGDLPKLK